MRVFALFVSALGLAGCASGVGSAGPLSSDPQNQFLANIAAHCGKAFEGRVVTTDPADAGFASQRLVMHVASCAPGKLKVPFHVGEDRSRTWILTRTDAGIQLKHDHRHQDGTPDVQTMYGGDTTGRGTEERQEFPVDAESISLFQKTGANVSTTNVWAMEVRDGEFVYELHRANRHFRVVFDLSKPIDIPPYPWGWQ